MTSDEQLDKFADAKVEFIFSATTYEDNNGRVLTERTVVSGKPPDDFARFIVSASIQTATPIGPMQWQFEIRLHGATTPEDAYAALEVEWPSAVEKAKEEMNAFVSDQIAAASKRIMVPGVPVPKAPGGPLQLPGMREKR
jgi:hypothetical protein